MTKLLYITNQICGPGGLERVLSIKTKYLIDNLKYEIHILTLNQGQEDLFYDFNDKIIYHDIIVGGNLLLYFKLYKQGITRVLKKIKPDITLVCDDGIKGLLLPYIIKKPCPMIYERHVSKNIELKFDNPSFIEKAKTWFKFKLMDFGANYYDAFVVLTNGNKREWKTKNIHVIPNPLSFYPKKQSTLKNKKVIAVGKQSFQKGYDRLLQSWELVNKKYPDWNLDIYGTINKSENLGELAVSLNIFESVKFHEPVKNIADKYQQASIYAMSSRYEGFGMVLTEAMAFGVPCVSFDCPYGPGDIIYDGIDGFLVPNGDITLLSDKLNSLIEDEVLRTKMGEKARENVKRYLPENIISQWDTLFKQLIEAKL